MIVGVIGAGTMGAGIAQVCLEAGHEVLLNDIDEAAIERGRARIASGLEKSVAKGRIDAGSASEAMSERLRDGHGLDSLAAEADLVIEAAMEDLDLKRTIFRALGQAASPTAILATNTSALSVTEIAGVTAQPGRVLGLHFFNPAPVMALVEVVAAPRTDANVLAAAVAFVEGLAKTPVVCRDAPGFIVNRVNRPFTLEALRLVEHGRARPEDVDRAVEGSGYPMGPFRLMDLVGIDVNLAVARSLFEAFDEAPRFRPSELQETLVAAGSFGRKTAMGFYRYDTEGSATGPSVSREEREDRPPHDPIPDAQIVQRIELAIINEAYRVVGDEVASPEDVDLAMKLGAGHPYGPFERAGALGLRAVVDGLRSLADSEESEAAERFAVAPALWSVATM